MTDKTNVVNEFNNSADQIVLTLKNLANGHDKKVVLPDNHRTVVAALEFFAENEQVPMSAIDLQISPLLAQAVMSAPVQQAMAA